MSLSYDSAYHLRCNLGLASGRAVILDRLQQEDDILGSPRGCSESQSVPEWLPLVTCVARFRDSAPAQDRSKHGSVLTVVWFQDEFATPIVEPALSSLVNLDWDGLASDFEW